MSDTTPMTLTNARALIDRHYNETGRFQWAREVTINAVEAGATQIHFGLERRGVEVGGVYRRFIADNGCGMDEDELVRFFRTLGASNKAVGGAHENFGVGAKVTLLPWNTEGLLVISWKNGEGNVIWAKADEETGEYGLRKVQVDDALCDVWPVGPDPELDFDLDDLKPDWIADHGTVILLLGDSLDQHTIRNDPRHDLAGTRQLRDYLTRRFWKIPDGVTVRVDELATDQPSGWWKPKNPSKPLDSRLVHGMNEQQKKLAADHTGVVNITGAKVHWKLRLEPEAKGESWSWQRGFIAALYRDELYEHKTKHYDYRDFGVAHADVRKGLWLILEPRLANRNRERGAFPEADRNSLLWNQDGENSQLPWKEWAQEFAASLPEPIREALAKHRRSGRLDDKDYQQRLADLFGSRFRIPRLQVDSEGDAKVTADAGKIRTRRRARRGRPNPNTDEKATHGRDGTAASATQVDTQQGIPRWAECDEASIEPGMLAFYSPNDPEGPTVYVYTKHPVIEGQVQHWTEHYPHLPDEVRECVEDVYGECGVAAVAHSAQFKSLGVDRRTIREHLRSPYALTLALLGLMAQDQLISQRLANRFGARYVEREGAKVAA